MHILIIHQAFAALDEPGGTRHHELARHLAKKGHHVTIIASPVSYLTGTIKDDGIQDSSHDSDEEGITVLRAYTYPALHRSFLHRIISFLSFMGSSFIVALQVRDVDLVWGTSPPIFQGATAWIISRLKRVPFLFEVRDLWPAFAIEVGVLNNPILIRASEWLERFLYSHADLTIVNSPGFIQHVEKKGAKQIELVPNGSDTAMFHPQDKGVDFRLEYQIGLEDKFVALYAGAHGMSNDLNILLDAANILQDHENIEIVLLGDGKDKPNLMSRADKMNLKNVHFIYPIPKTQMSRALAAADTCIAILKPIPLYRTVYPNKVFDYMAAGRPVVLAIDGVIREVVEDAQAGIFVAPGSADALANAIIHLSSDPVLCSNMGSQGRQYIEKHFDRQQLAKKLISIMEDLVFGK
jgi:glycosyltransferase involved in cell wall biosynthesis